MLLLAHELRHGAAVTADLEDRVVAEAVRAARRVGDVAAHLTVEELRPAVGPGEGGHADEARATGLHAFEHSEQPRVALLGRGVLAEEPAAAQPRRAVERVDLEARVVGHGAQAARRRVRARLEGCVLRERRALFRRLRRRGAQLLGDDECEIEAGEELAVLALLPGIRRPDEQALRPTQSLDFGQETCSRLADSLLAVELLVARLG